MDITPEIRSLNRRATLQTDRVISLLDLGQIEGTERLICTASLLTHIAESLLSAASALTKGQTAPFEVGEDGAKVVEEDGDLVLNVMIEPAWKEQVTAMLKDVKITGVKLRNVVDVAAPVCFAPVCFVNAARVILDVADDNLNRAARLE